MKFSTKNILTVQYVIFLTHMYKMNTNKKEEILNAALYCFNKKGYYKASIDDIARRAKITKGGVYYYFSSKKNLFIQLFHSMIKKYFNRLSAKTEQTRNPIDGIRLLIEQAGEDLEANLDIYTFCLEFIIISIREKDIRKEVTSFYRKRLEILTQIIQDGINAGTIKELDPQNIAWNLNFFSIGFMTTYLTSDIFFDPTSQHTINLEIFLNGIKRTSSRKTLINTSTNTP